MYELKITTHFAAAHQLRNFRGSCENLHGHNWKVEVYVVGEELQEDGTVIDFHELKDFTNKVLDTLDHKFLNDLEAFREVNPSSENIAKYIYESLERDLKGRGIKVSRVTAWESEDCCASYFKESRSV